MLSQKRKPASARARNACASTAAASPCIATSTTGCLLAGSMAPLTFDPGRAQSSDLACLTQAAHDPSPNLWGEGSDGLSHLDAVKTGWPFSSLISCQLFSIAPTTYAGIGTKSSSS